MKLLIVLLQADPTSTLIDKIGNQGFAVTLLITVSWLLWQRITKVQDRLDTYLSEDRKEMSEVINNNTKVMQEFLNNVKK